jgi:hypothetical protein
MQHCVKPDFSFASYAAYNAVRQKCLNCLELLQLQNFGSEIPSAWLWNFEIPGKCKT